MSNTTTTRTRRPAAKAQTPKPIRKEVPAQAELLASKAAANFDEEKDYTYLADKEPTDLHVSMAAWITQVTGVAIDPKAVQLASVLRHEFQASPTNQRDLEARRVAAQAKAQAREEAKVAKAKADLKKAQDILKAAAKAAPAKA